MTKIKKSGLIFVLALGVYVFSFKQLDSVYVTDETVYLSQPPSSTTLSITFPYLHQLVGEALYVRTAVYMGSVIEHQLKVDPELLAVNFEVMQKMQPYLFDIYHMENAYLPEFGQEYVIRSNIMLKDGILKRPDEWRLPFYLGFNYFHHLKDNDAAYTYLLQAYELSGNRFFKHLAAVLAAKDGNLKVGALWLRAMYETEPDTDKKKSILVDLKAYDAALKVKASINQYYQTQGYFPKSLSSLIPMYLDAMPKIEASFEIVYDGQGTVKLQRPQLPK